ncbi:M28 family peptidase [Streptomyces sp. NBC_01142]|uniref:M28 family peptidase n=1 Tax=Streptomyces sp. NBC_01142 TaxID=2975865 RepID=UPI0022539E54|nr:M28 family peptidase [Streptomyces sp. NBC_01142]MCX4825354.1 M28 family peptidase [Streptomyces sp. NBC_01142]
MLPDPDVPSLVRELTRRADPLRLRHDVEFLADRPRSRTRAPEAMLRAETHVTSELAAAGWRTERQPFDVRWRLGSTDRRGDHPLALGLRLHRRLAGANLLAGLPGGDDRPTVVVGAHLDTVDGSPGADDNASGVAALLEIARLLGRLPRPPAVTLMFFDMEELGLIGSRVAARRLRRTRQIVGMICLESVGFFAGGPGTQLVPAGFGAAFPGVAATIRAGGQRGDFTLVVHRRSTRAAASLWRRAAKVAEPSLPVITLRDPRPDGPLGALAGLAVPPVNHLGRSDHAAFWNAGIPALMLTGTANFRNPHYHRPTDTPDTIDYRRLAAVAVATAVTAVSWPAGGGR